MDELQNDFFKIEDNTVHIDYRTTPFFYERMLSLMQAVSDDLRDKKLTYSLVAGSPFMDGTGECEDKNWILADTSLTKETGVLQIEGFSKHLEEVLQFPIHYVLSVYNQLPLLRVVITFQNEDEMETLFPVMDGDARYEDGLLPYFQSLMDNSYMNMMIMSFSKELLNYMNGTSTTEDKELFELKCKRNGIPLEAILNATQK